MLKRVRIFHNGIDAERKTGESMTIFGRFRAKERNREEELRSLVLAKFEEMRRLGFIDFEGRFQGSVHPLRATWIRPEVTAKRLDRIGLIALERVVAASDLAWHYSLLKLKFEDDFESFQADEDSNPAMAFWAAWAHNEGATSLSGTRDSDLVAIGKLVWKRQRESYYDCLLLLEKEYEKFESGRDNRLKLFVVAAHSLLIAPYGYGLYKLWEGGCSCLALMLAATVLAFYTWIFGLVEIITWFF